MEIVICNLRDKMYGLPYDVRVDRYSVLGNPFRMKNEYEREEVCEAYKEYFDYKLNNDAEFVKELVRIYNLLLKYGKIRLFCWCFPKRCHAETIKSFLETKYVERNGK